MTRQQHITKAQVRFKLHDAQQRAMFHMERALNAPTLCEYNALIAQMNKAARDAETWRAVLDAL